MGDTNSISSMTGFARAQVALKGLRLGVDVAPLNQEAGEMRATYLAAFCQCLGILEAALKTQFLKLVTN